MNKSAHGKIFEKIIASSWVDSGINLERLNLSETGAERSCDEVVIGDLILYNELKSTMSSTYKMSMVKLHQIRTLHKLHQKRPNVYSMVFVEFAKYNTMTWFTIEEYVNLIKSGTSSIKYKELDKFIIKDSKGYYPLQIIMEELNENTVSTK